jgi:hypothetical protein
MTLDDRAHLTEVARKQLPQRLRIQTLAELRRACHIAEQHAYDLALLMRRWRLIQPFPARFTEPGTRSVRMAADLAFRHTATLDPIADEGNHPGDGSGG